MNRRDLRYVALQLAAPLVAIIFASLVGSLIIAAIGKNPLSIYGLMFSFSFSRLDSVASILFKATPLMFTGLATALCFRLGLFNIGIEGQYLVGAFTAAWAGFALHGLPAVIHLPLMLVCGMAGGVIWAALPMFLKIRRGAHEVITTIMMNYIAFALIQWLIADVFIDRAQSTFMGLGSPRVRTPLLPDSAHIPTLHGLLRLFGVELPSYVYVNWMLILGLAVAGLLAFIIWRTTFGYEFRCCAENPDAAEAAGIRVPRMQALAFIAAGAIAGLAGLSDLGGYFGYMDVDFPRNYGFNGIAVALLGKNDPFGVVLAALLFGFLQRGAEGVQALAQVPMEVIVILQGIMILSIVVAYELVTRYIRRQKQREAQSHVVG